MMGKGNGEHRVWLSCPTHHDSPPWTREIERWRIDRNGHRLAERPVALPSETRSAPMSITPFLGGDGSAFDSETKRVMGVAFEMA
jgi:hypothetical protein